MFSLISFVYNYLIARIATASDKGTVIRVFNCENGSKLYELRRGLKRTATIYRSALTRFKGFWRISRKITHSSQFIYIYIFLIDFKLTLGVKNSSRK